LSGGPKLTQQLWYYIWLIHYL